MIDPNDIRYKIEPDLELQDATPYKKITVQLRITLINRSSLDKSEIEYHLSKNHSLVWNKLYKDLYLDLVELKETVLDHIRTNQPYLTELDTIQKFNLVLDKLKTPEFKIALGNSNEL